MKKEQLLRKVSAAWDDLTESYAGLDETDMTAPGAAGAWSLKDVLAHVTTWEQEALKYLPLILAGGKPPRYADQYGGINAFNDQMTEQKRGLPLGEVLRQMAETHQALITYVQSAPDEQFTTETRFRRRIRLDTYAHYPHHAAAIRAWRQGAHK